MGTVRVPLSAPLRRPQNSMVMICGPASCPSAVAWNTRYSAALSGLRTVSVTSGILIH